MAEFFAVFDAAPVGATGADVGVAPIASTKILAPLMTAKVAYIEAADLATVQRAVRSYFTPQAGVGIPSPLLSTAYAGEAPIVVTKAQWKES